MKNPPQPPAGYKEPQQYQMPKWVQVVTVVVLLGLFIFITEFLGVQYRLSHSLFSFIIALMFTIAGSVYLHESAHYVVGYYLNYDPDFIWPTRVKFGVDILRTKPTVAILLAPQLLSGLYVAFIHIGVAPVLESMLVWALGINLLPGVYDIAWAIRRLAWPNGTIIIIDGCESYVTFPRE